MAAISAVNTLEPGEFITVVMVGANGDSWDGHVLAVDATAIRLQTVKSKMGPIESNEDSVIVLPWSRIEWVEPTDEASS